jgi:hypothetical protein
MRGQCGIPINISFAAHFIFRKVWFSFSKISKSTFYLAKFDFPFPRYQKAFSISRSLIFLYQDIKKHFLSREVWFSFSKISKSTFYPAKYNFPLPRYQKALSISRSTIFLFQDIKKLFLFREVWFSFTKISKNTFYLAKYNFPFPRYQKALSISRSMIFLLLEVFAQPHLHQDLSSKIKSVHYLILHFGKGKLYSILQRIRRKRFRWSNAVVIKLSGSRDRGTLKIFGGIPKYVKFEICTY